jgi:hypothetical protein
VGADAAAVAIGEAAVVVSVVAGDVVSVGAEEVVWAGAFFLFWSLELDAFASKGADWDATFCPFTDNSGSKNSFLNDVIMIITEEHQKQCLPIVLQKLVTVFGLGKRWDRGHLAAATISNIGV